MPRTHGAEIKKCQHLVVFAKFRAGNFAFDNATKNAKIIGHVFLRDSRGCRIGIFQGAMAALD
jgi:hypothetical protein